MKGLSIDTGFFMERDSLLFKLIKEKPELEPHYTGLRDKLLKLGESYSERLDEIAGGFAGGRGGDVMLKLTVLLDSRDRRVKEALLEYNTDLFSDLGFLAEEVADVIKNKRMDAAGQLAGLLLNDYGVLGECVWSLVSYINVIDGGYVNSSDDENIKLLSENMDSPAALLEMIEGKITAAKKYYNTETQHQLYKLLALRQITLNLR